MTPRSALIATCTALSLFAGAALAQEKAYFSFAATHQLTLQPHEFVFEVHDPAMIKKLRDIINGNYQGNDTHLEGTIVTSRADYNEEWPFHLDPDSIRTFSFSIEHCDADPFIVEDNLALVGRTDPDDPTAGFLADNHWCPWDSRLVREVKYTGDE